MDARDALTRAAARRQQTIHAGTTAWSHRVIAGICASVLTLGSLVALGMVWLWAVLVVIGASAAWNDGVRLRPTHASRRWQLALAGTAVLALGADVLAQFPARALDRPLPNTVGAAGACLVVLALTRPCRRAWPRACARERGTRRRDDRCTSSCSHATADGHLHGAIDR